MDGTGNADWASPEGDPHGHVASHRTSEPAGRRATDLRPLQVWRQARIVDQAPRASCGRSSFRQLARLRRWRWRSASMEEVAEWADVGGIREAPLGEDERHFTIAASQEELSFGLLDIREVRPFSDRCEVTDATADALDRDHDLIGFRQLKMNRTCSGRGPARRSPHQKADSMDSAGEETSDQQGQ
jgi:hypothetical protein